MADDSLLPRRRSGQVLDQLRTIRTALTSSLESRVIVGLITELLVDSVLDLDSPKIDGLELWFDVVGSIRRRFKVHHHFWVVVDDASRGSIPENMGIHYPL